MEIRAVLGACASLWSALLVDFSWSWKQSEQASSRCLGRISSTWNTFCGRLDPSRCLLLRLTSCVIFAMKTATNSQDYERHTVSTRLTLYYDGHAVAVSHYACRAQTSQGKVPGLCPIPQVFEKEDEPNRNRTWIRLLRHETGRPLHV